MKVLQPILVGTVVGFLCAVAFTFGIFHEWSERVTDQLFLQKSSDASVVVVAIDDASLTQIGRWPWPREVHARLITRLSQAGATVIGYDVNFPEPSDELQDAALADALKASGRVVLPVELEISATRNGPQYTPNHVLAPIARIASSAAATGHGNVMPDADGIVRRSALLIPQVSQDQLNIQPIPSFVAEVVRLTGRYPSMDAAPVERGQMRISFVGAPSHTYHTLSAVEVLRGTADLSILKEAVVFVGATAPDLHDAHLVPTSRGVPMPGVEIHAAIFDTIQHQRWLVPLPWWLMALLVLLLGVFVGLVVPFVGSRWSLVVVGTAWVAVVIVALGTFDQGHIIDIVWPTIALLVSFIAVTLERRVHADRKRRELQKAFSQYVAPAVVDSIVRSPELLKLGGVRKRMTVLFSDIRGFTSIAESQPPETLVELLNAYLSRMTEIVFQHQGVLDKFIGDAVMAFWNAPLEQKNHAELGVRTALDMVRALEGMNQTQQFGKNTLRIGVGVTTGEMVVGNIGGDTRFNYTVIGDTVNLASRLEGLTKEYGVSILATEATVQECLSAFVCRKIDRVAVKGKKDSVVIYEVMATQAEATEGQRALIRSYEAALEAYCARDFAAAAVQCAAILLTAPNDGPTYSLKARAERFQHTPPPADWSGTWVFTTK